MTLVDLRRDPSSYRMRYLEVTMSSAPGRISTLANHTTRRRADRRPLSSEKRLNHAFLEAFHSTQRLPASLIPRQVRIDHSDTLLVSIPIGEFYWLK